VLAFVQNIHYAWRRVCKSFQNIDNRYEQGKGKAENMVDPQNFTDRMLETENLTDALEDEEADFLLNWGVAKLKQKLVDIEDSGAADEYTNALMGFMRSLNQIAGDLENLQAESLVQLAERRRKAFGTGREMEAEAFEEESARLKAMTTHQAIEYLLLDKE
jgi:hypothetical protein